MSLQAPILPPSALHFAVEPKVGRSLTERGLLVSFVELPEAIRIISARRADARERRTYEEGIQQAE